MTPVNLSANPHRYRCSQNRHRKGVLDIDSIVVEKGSFPYKFIGVIHFTITCRMGQLA